MTSIRETFTLEQADRLLTENTFFCDEDLWDVIEYADDEAYEFIYKNRSKYAGEIQYLLEPKDFIPPAVKMSVREMTDKDMVDLERARRAILIASLEDTWSKMDKPERPHDELDQAADEAWEKLTAIRNRISEQMSNKKPSKYVPPSQRGKPAVSTQIDATLEQEFEECKKQYEEIEKRIESADKKYIADKKNEFFSQYV